MGVAVGVGTSTSLGGGKTEAKIRSWRVVIVIEDEDQHGRAFTPRTSDVQSASKARSPSHVPLAYPSSKEVGERLL